MIKAIAHFLFMAILGGTLAEFAKKNPTAISSVYAWLAPVFCDDRWSEVSGPMRSEVRSGRVPREHLDMVSTIAIGSTARSRKKSCIFALSLITLAGLSPAAADPVEVSKLDTTALRALFHSPTFNIVCPLAVYDEDYSQTKIIQSSTLVPSQSLGTTRAFPTFAVSEFLRTPDSTLSDGLGVYGEDFTNASCSNCPNSK